MTCIYCNSHGPFNKEHIIPQSLGNFIPDVFFSKKDELVCHNCNSIIFSKLETEFIEDSIEGIFSKMFNFSGSGSVRIRSEKVIMDFFNTLGDNFFKQIFPFLKVIENEIKVQYLPQIKIRNYGGEGGYQIFLIESLKKLKVGSRDHNRIKERLKSTKGTDISIFALGMTSDDEENIEDAIKILQEFDVKYTENENKVIPSPMKISDKFRMEFKGIVNQNSGRLIAKIAFNYFAYCISLRGDVSILFSEELLNIKNFILAKGEISVNDILINMKQSNQNVAYIFHVYSANGFLLVDLSFLGITNYTIKLGKLPPGLNESVEFIHIFNPFSKEVTRIK